MARLSACRAVHQQETNKRLAITAFQLSGQFSTSRKSPRPFVSEQRQRENFDNVCAVGFWMTALLFCVLARGSSERDTAPCYLLRLFSIADRRRWHNNSPAIIIPHAAAECWLAQRAHTCILFHSSVRVVLLVRTRCTLMLFPYFASRIFFLFIMTQDWGSTLNLYFFAQLWCFCVTFLLQGHILLQRGRQRRWSARPEKTLLIKARWAFNWIAFYASFVWCLLHRKKRVTLITIYF
jgi:hypothetical protein